MVRSGKHVLVVDDSPPCLRICKILLESAGYSVALAGSAPEAICALSDNLPDILICDLLLGPVGSGFDVVDVARALEDSILCIAVTALVTSDIRQTALDRGFDAFLRKPYKFGQLLELVTTKR